MNVAFEILTNIKAKGLPLIDQWVADGYREDLHLDFKRKRKPSSPKLDDDDRRNFSKALSGFANSDSGIIVWGIGAPGSGVGIRTKHAIKKVNMFAEHLDSLISRYVSPYVAGVENFVVYEDENKKTGYVITYVPRSDSSPHRAEADGVKNYYKRYGDSFKIAEHYELEYMFGKRLFPDLGVFWGVDVIETIDKTDSSKEVVCSINIGITNQGKAVGNYACIRLRYDRTSKYVLEEHHKSDLIHYSKPADASKENFAIVTARALPGLVIYPEDHTHFFSFTLNCKSKDIISGNLPKFELNYDLFAENQKSVRGADYIIAGRKIATAISKKIELDD